MFRQAGILFALIVSVASLRILQEPQNSISQEDSCDGIAGCSLGTSDKIVFDKGAWTPNCDDLLQYAQQPIDMNACLAYQQSKSSKYKDIEEQMASSPRDTKIKMFLHISKSAGSLACECGNANGENPEAVKMMRKSMCLGLREDFPWWGDNKELPWFATTPPTKTEDCNEYEETLAKLHVTLEHNENYLPREGKLCDNLENTIIVRDPIQRLASHISFLIGEEGARNMTLTKMNTDYPRLADNYLARSLAGLSAFQAEFGVLPESTDRKSMQTLRSFDNVFIMDEFLNPEFELFYGWRSCDTVSAKVSSATGGTPAIVGYWKKTWPEGDWELLLNQHKFDKKLFKEAQYQSFHKSFLKYMELFSGSPGKDGMKDGFQQKIQ